MRKLAYLALAIFLIVGAFAVYTLVSAVRKGAEVIQNPIAALARQLVIEATPVILPDPVTIVNAINDKAELVTASYEMQKVLTAETNQEFLWGAFGENMIFVAYGEVVAGVDLTLLQPEDVVVVDPDTVMIHLPDAQVFPYPILDNERSQVLDRETGLFADADPQLETQVRQQAEVEILAAALEAGILERADGNAEAYMQEFLLGLGFENVTFTDTIPPPADPFVQEVPKGFAVTPPPTPLVTPTPLVVPTP